MVIDFSIFFTQNLGSGQLTIPILRQMLYNNMLLTNDILKFGPFLVKEPPVLVGEYTHLITREKQLMETKIIFNEYVKVIGKEWFVSNFWR